MRIFLPHWVSALAPRSGDGSILPPLQLQPDGSCFRAPFLVMPFLPVAPSDPGMSVASGCFSSWCHATPHGPIYCAWTSTNSLILKSLIWTIWWNSVAARSLMNEPYMEPISKKPQGTALFSLLLFTASFLKLSCTYLLCPSLLHCILALHPVRNLTHFQCTQLPPQIDDHQVHSFVQQIFTEHLLRVKHCSRHGMYRWTKHSKIHALIRWCFSRIKSVLSALRLTSRILILVSQRMSHTPYKLITSEPKFIMTLKVWHHRPCRPFYPS